MIKFIVILVILFIVYKFCEISSYSDNKDLEDEMFIDTYKDDEKN